MESQVARLSTRRRNERLSLRVSTAQKAMIQRAAARRGTTVTAFVLAQVEAAARQVVDPRPDRTPERFEVVCHIDAFADYVAEVEAEDAGRAAVLADENHNDYAWRHQKSPTRVSSISLPAWSSVT
jgi:hypothetical protein